MNKIQQQQYGQVFWFSFFWFSKSFLVPHYFDIATFTCCNVGSLLGVTNGSKCGLYLKNEKANMYIMAPVNISMKYVQIKLKTKNIFNSNNIENTKKMALIRLDQTSSKLIKFDQI
jgi:hypothetical protein